MKKVLCITITVCLLAGLFVVPASAESVDRQPAALQPGESLAQNPVYYMDFSPDADGKFYDSPAGAEGRKEVTLKDEPDGITKLTGSDNNVNDKIIGIDATSRMIVSREEATLYCAFSKANTEGDLNSGASGALDDYCLKSVDASTTISGTAFTRMILPGVYGDEEDSCKKYRIELDWKWQGYGSGNAQTAVGSPGGATIVSFFIGGNRVCLVGKSNSDTSGDARGNNALYFQGYSGESGTTTAFSLFSSNQKTVESEMANVTKSAARFTEAQSGKWVHITVDMDFANSTIYATLEGDGETRKISTEITGDNNKALFAKGISAVGIYGSTKADKRVNFADNIKITPIMTEAPTLQADDTKLKWQAIDGATSYKVYSGASEAEALASTTPVEGLTLDTTSEDGYVIAALDNLDAAAPTYYTVTAISANKGESIKSNAVKSPVKNFISDITYEITGSGSSQATVKATAEIDAVAGFDSAVSLIAAAYDGDTLIGVNLSEPVSLGKGETQTIEVSLGGLPAASTQDMEMKFFLWDANLKPIKMRSVTAWDASVVE